MKTKVEFLCIKTVYLNDNPAQDVLYIKDNRYLFAGKNSYDQYHPFKVVDENGSHRNLSFGFLEEHFAI